MAGKQLIPLFLILAAFVLAMTLVSAGTMVTPANGATVGGTVILNASGTNLGRCNFSVGSATSANSTWTAVKLNVANQSALAKSINATFNSLILEDANDYSFNATCTNLTGSLVPQTLTTSVIVDNTVPTTPSSLVPADAISNTTSTGFSVVFSSTVNDPSTTSCNFTIARDNLATSSAGYSTVVGTYSTNTCSYTNTFGSTDYGSWFYKFTASDGLNTTDSSIQSIVLKAAAGGSPSVPAAVQPQSSTQSSQGLPIAQSISTMLSSAWNGVQSFIQSIFGFFNKSK